MPNQTLDAPTAPSTAPSSRASAAAPASLPAISADKSAADYSREEFDYLFDVRGYHILRGALSPQQLDAINGFVDDHDVDSLQPGQWIGDVEVHTYGSKDGVNFQNILEGGEAFEELIDNPAWFGNVERYIKTHAHKVRIDECFLNVRRSGGYIPIHSGGFLPRLTSIFRWHTGVWAVSQINILMALTDVGPGDGATTIVPGSHKAHMDHPNRDWTAAVGGDKAVGMHEVHLKAGDALMFTDAVAHGSIPRTNPGERRVLIYRYTPHLVASRFNYIPSPELLARLTPRRRAVVQPVAPRMNPERTLRFDDLPPIEG